MDDDWTYTHSIECATEGCANRVYLTAGEPKHVFQGIAKCRECWEAKFALEDEQIARDNRDDLCSDCKPVDHSTCSLDATCACCRTTILAMEGS